MPEKTINARRVTLYVPPEVITDLHALTEACDHIAFLRTLDPDLAIVELVCTPDTHLQALELARYFEKSMGAEIISDGARTAGE